MNNPDKKDKIIGLVCSLIFHAVIILILFFTKMHHSSNDNNNDNEGGGILVAYGVAEYEDIKEETPSYTPPAVTPSTEEITQDSDEPSISVEEEEKKREEEERIAKEEEERKEQERQEAISKETSSKVTDAFAALNKNQGRAESKGSPNGNSDSGAMSGNAGFGTHDLGGRGFAKGESLPRPQYDNSNDEGKLVVDITVNPEGDVVDASINSSKSSASIRTNYDLRNSAINAAKKAKFEAIKNSNNQKGTITYFFKISQ